MLKSYNYQEIYNKSMVLDLKQEIKVYGQISKEIEKQ